MRTIGALLLTALLLAGCSSGSDDSSASDKGETIKTATTLPSLAVEDIDVNASPYCAQWAEVRRVAGDDIGDLDESGVRAHYAELAPTVEKLLTTAPDELRSSVQGALDATRAAAESGTNESFATDAAAKVQKKLLTYAYDHCRKR